MICYLVRKLAVWKKPRTKVIWRHDVPWMSLNLIIFQYFIFGLHSLYIYCWNNRQTNIFWIYYLLRPSNYSYAIIRIHFHQRFSLLAIFIKCLLTNISFENASYRHIFIWISVKWLMFILYAMFHCGLSPVLIYLKC